jgi:hypothetical protein
VATESRSARTLRPKSPRIAARDRLAAAAPTAQPERAAADVRMRLGSEDSAAEPEPAVLTARAGVDRDEGLEHAVRMRASEDSVESLVYRRKSTSIDDMRDGAADVAETGPSV